MWVDLHEPVRKTKQPQEQRYPFLPVCAVFS